MEIQAETLALLEWERLGEQVAGFAGSCLGANLCRPLQLAPTLEEAQRRQTETAELLVLDGLTEGGLSFQGVSDHSIALPCATRGRSSSLSQQTRSTARGAFSSLLPVGKLPRSALLASASV